MRKDKVCLSALTTDIVPINPCHVHGAGHTSKVGVPKIKTALGSNTNPLNPFYYERKFQPWRATA